MSIQVVYRDVEIRDEKPLASMIRRAFEEYDAPRQGTVFSDPTTDKLYAFSQGAGTVLWVAEVDGQAAGCCGIYPTEGLPEGYAELGRFYLASEYRGLGIGRELMEKSIASARRMGYTHLYLESLPHFDKAVSIYEKLGFETLDAPLGNSGHHSCDIWMLLRL